MFMACGVSMYSAALFHLVTHAFFKALLFLSAGSVIHAMSGEQNIRKMGGLYSKIPVTYTFVWLGSLALAGLPFFAGYYSKDWILDALYIHHETGGSLLPYIIGSITAFLTAFYSWRLISLVFHGDARANERVMSHVHEAPLSMQFPKAILALGAIFSGVALQALFTDAFYINKAYAFIAEKHTLSWLIMELPALIATVGVLMAVWVYHAHRNTLSVSLYHYKKVCGFIQSGVGINELYRWAIVKPIHVISEFAYRYVDKGLIDRYAVNGIAHIINRTSNLLRCIQTGQVGDYAMMMIVGLIIILGYVVVVIR
jgi:NADH-quinone oxidoreductase subunit L